MCYVGRAGRFHKWPHHPLANPFKPGDIRYRDTPGHGTNPLGCWCADWDGKSEPAPACHAVILAKMIRERFVEGNP